MNDFLQQLLSVGPGLGAGLTGNGPGMNAFMDGYQRTMALLEEQRRRREEDKVQAENAAYMRTDRDRQFTRQQELDKQAGIDRDRRRAVEELQIPGTLAEVGAGAEDPQSAQARIEAMMPRLMEVFGQGAMAYGQPAVEEAQRTITGRQKKQVEAFVEQALKTAYVADHPEADPDFTQLPEHISLIIGKPTARLSELQQFAQLPVGKPAGRTRTPAAAGSFEEYSDPSTPPERKAQIEADRKRYMQADDRPVVNVNTGGGGTYPPSLQRRIDALAKGFDTQPVVKKIQTMAEAVRFSEGLKSDTTNPADDQALIYAFAKAMDPESVVREGEYATVQKYAQSWAERFGFDVKRIFSNTSFLTPQARQQLKATIRSKFDAELPGYTNVRNEYGRRIERITGKPGGAEELIDYSGGFPDATKGTTPAKAPTRGSNPFRPPQ